MRVMIGLIVGLGIGIAGTAVAHTGASSLVRPPCIAKSDGGWVCLLPLPANNRGSTYEIQVIDLDLDCTLSPSKPSIGLSELFDCDRLNGPPKSCFNGQFGTTTAVITRTRMTISSPTPCVATPSGRLPFRATGRPIEKSLVRAP
jgi:hypothetical protein